MKFALTDEQQELQRTVRQFLGRESSIADLRKLIEPEVARDPVVWKKMATDLGLLGLVIPEQYGGLGASSVELGAVLEEAGRALLVSPYFATAALATQALLISGDEAAQARYFPGIAAGEVTATFALMHGDFGGSSLVATDRDDGCTVSGEAKFVLSGADVDILFVEATDPAGGTSVYAIDATSAGVVAERLRTADLTRPLADIRLSEAPVVRVGKAGDGSRIADGVATRAAIYLACEQVGGSKACLDMAVAYAKVRNQFNRPIGSFQAIKHMLADVLLETESAWAAAFYAVTAIDVPGENLPLLASMAKSVCSEAFFLAAGTNIQVHGGIGFTWEQDCHFYFKRASGGKQLLGSTQYHQERIASLVTA